MKKETSPENHFLVKGRGAQQSPSNRFETTTIETDGDWLDHLYQVEGPIQRIPTRFHFDQTRTALTENQSPDIPYNFGINPYRGCEHGCIYCYARPTHEYLGYSAGLDFETEIHVKKDLPSILAKELRSKKWEAQTVAMSGNTDCYQPAERTYQLSRESLKVFLARGNPVDIITKSALILRDLDLLTQLAAKNLVRVTISVTTLDPTLSSAMEPRAATPAHRLNVISKLCEAGIPVGVNIAPLIPGLTDHELSNILVAAKEAGAKWARYLMLRLPHGVADLFLDWVQREYPQKATKVKHAIEDIRDGNLTENRFNKRFRGEGLRADAIEKLFQLKARQLGLPDSAPSLSVDHYHRDDYLQQTLF